jgi:hypothetical protein
MTDEIAEKSLLNILPTREPYQRSTNLSEAYLTRFTPAWQRPIGWNTNMWRAWVMNQPIAIICRETLIANLLSLNWKITPKDMSYKTELDATIRYYTKLFEKGGNNPELELDYSSLVEWIAADLLDTPFGGVAEVGRKGDTENGRVMWLKPLDAATMYPTLNKDFPAVQYYNGVDAIPFPTHAIARTYMTPRPYMDRQGWGMAVPEKVYFAMDMLSRGDKYYANLLLDIPTAGILDLGDMEKSSAEEWVESFKAFMGDSEQAFRIPVLYEHNNPIQYIPFGKVPNDIMFDNITMKYAAIVASAYGMTLNDIGLSSTGAGGTLAGTIRSDIKYNKTGFARAKAKIKYFFNQILPDSLEFNFIDYDYELNVAMGRARLASSTAFQTFIGMKAFSPQEIRNQAIQDGLFSITIPDELPPDSEFPEPEVAPAVTGTQKKKVGKLTGTNKVGNPKPATQGGEGEFNTRSLTDDKILLGVQKMVEAMPHIAQYLSDAGEDDREVAKLILKIEPPVIEYLSEIGNIVGSREFADVLFDGTVSILDEFAFDTAENIVYDNMVETLMSKVNHSNQKKEEN